MPSTIYICNQQTAFSVFNVISVYNDSQGALNFSTVAKNIYVQMLYTIGLLSRDLKKIIYYELELSPSTQEITFQ